jgi:hypothetical protein
MLIVSIFLKKLALSVQFWFWRRNHTMQDFEARMIELGCTKVNSGNSTIFTTPNKKGKIVVTDNEILINPR